ncbi:MAG: YHYH protein [Flavobacteriales bacterium]|nr:YHYH protein [Flavobacteriales bacterium]
MQKLFTILAFGFATATIAQTGYGELDNWIFSTGNCTYETYVGPPGGTTNTVNMTDAGDVLEICYDANNVYVRTNNLPGTYTAGPWTNPNVPIAQNYIFKIPRNPTPASGAHTAQPFGGPMAVSTNGISIYGFGDAKSYSSSANNNINGGDGLWNSDAWVSEGSTMDPTGNGHCDGTGSYHYHANPAALYNDPSSFHSPLIGFALDGYPIYGPFGYSSAMDNSSSITRMTSGYALRSITDRTVLPGGTSSIPPGPSDFSTFPLGTYWEDYDFTGTGTLDIYNGRDCVTPEYPTGTYAYFLATDGAGDPAFPYFIGSEYYGDVNGADIGPSATTWTVPGGTTCITQYTTSVGEILLEDVSMFPNPVNAQLTIDAGTSTVVSVLIYDTFGRLILSFNNTSQIDVSELSNGLYSVSIQTETGYAIKNLIKN